MAPALPPQGYTARAPTVDDAEAVADLIGACQVADGDERGMTAQELREDWERINLAEEAVVVSPDDGRIVASADILNRRYVRVSVYGYVHPEWRSRGLGSYLVAWGENWARERLDRSPEDARVVVEHYIRSSNEGARALLETRGYEPVRTVYVMAVNLEGSPPAPVWPEGIGVRAFRPGQDERALFEAGEDAFRDLWSRPPGTYEGWIGPTRSPGFDPTLWFLAEDRSSGEIAGFCLCQVVPHTVWVSSVGVRKPWRSRGVGLALLLHAFAEYERRGMRHVELSVDSESPTGAPRLYTRAGMHVEKSYMVYRKELRPGRDLSTLPDPE